MMKKNLVELQLNKITKKKLIKRIKKRLYLRNVCSNKEISTNFQEDTITY